MIYDIHVHVGSAVRRFDGSAGEAAEEMMARARLHGIERQCISSLLNPGNLAYPSLEQVRQGNDHALSLAAAYPRHYLPFCYLNPRHERAALDELHRCSDRGVVGIKLLVSCKASDPLVDPILERAAALRLPVLQHAWNKTVGQREHESTSADVAEAGRRHPGTHLIMAHLMGAGYRGVLDIAPMPNVHVDLSGGEPETGIVEYAVRHLGAERVLFGSDAPGRSYGVQLGKVLGADLTPGQRDLILWGNAERILRL
ncbi:MAG: amidohydrolase family protein [Armatimonadetes bacterium]|nr:amidohydrolase family protein [Armatimonadota bacterium]